MVLGWFPWLPRPSLHVERQTRLVARGHRRGVGACAERSPAFASTTTIHLGRVSTALTGRAEWCLDQAWAAHVLDLLVIWLPFDLLLGERDSLMLNLERIVVYPNCYRSHC